MRILILLLLFGIFTAISIPDSFALIGDRYYADKIMPNTQFREVQVEIQTSDLYVNSKDCKNNEVAVVTHWIKQDSYRWLEMGITSGAFGAGTGDSDAGLCNESPIIYWGKSIPVINSKTGNPERDYQEGFIANAKVGDIEFFKFQYVNERTWKGYHGDPSTTLPIIQDSPFSRNPETYQVGAESTINAITEYSSIPQTHFKNIKYATDTLSLRPITFKDTTYLEGGFQIEKCTDDSHLIAGSVTSLDCSRAVTQNQKPVVSDISKTLTDRNPITITLSATDPDFDYLQFNLDTHPTIGKLNVVNKSERITNVTPTTVQLTYTPDPQNAATSDSFNFVVSDGRSNHSVTKTVTLSIPSITTTPIILGSGGMTIDDSTPGKLVPTFSHKLIPSSNVSDWKLTATASPAQTIKINSIQTFSVPSTVMYVFHDSLPANWTNVTLEYVGSDIVSQDSTATLSAGTKFELNRAFVGGSNTGTTLTEFTEDFKTDLTKWSKSGSTKWILQATSLTIPGLSDNTPVYSSACNPACYLTMNDSVDLTQNTNQTLEFWRLLASTITGSEYARVDYSIDGGSNWSELAKFSQTSSLNPWKWTKQTYDLSSFSSSKQFKIRLVAYTTGGADIVQFDEIKISGTVRDTTVPVINIQSPTDNQTFTTDTITVSGTISDAESAISAVTAQLNSNSKVTIAGTGASNWSHTFTGLSDGVYLVKIQGTNNQSLSSNAFVTFTIKLPDTTPPTLVIPANITTEATAVLTPVNIGNATATDNSGVTPTITNNATSTFPVGTTIVTWTARDSAGNTSTITQIVIITNAAPAAVNDSVTLDEGSSTDIHILNNDSDVNGTIDASTVTIITSPIHGKTTINPTSGIVTYTHDNTETISDTFKYTVKDNAGLTSNEATVSININKENDSPVLGSIGDKTVNALELLTFTVTATDVDIPADTLTFTLIDVTGQGLHGSTLDTTSGVFTWTPTEVQVKSTPYYFMMAINDGYVIDSEIIKITVNKVDTISPFIDIGSVHPSADILKVGDTFEIIITPREFESGLVSHGTPTINGVNATFNEINNTGIYSVMYTVSAGDNNLSDDSDLLVNITLKDNAGNISNTISSIRANAVPVIDASTP